MHEVCKACHSVHRTEAEKQKCAQAQLQSDAVQMTMKRDFAKRFGFSCPWCGSVHATRKEITECREVG